MRISSCPEDFLCRSNKLGSGRIQSPPKPLQPGTGCSFGCCWACCPLAGVTTFRTGSSLGRVAAITSTLTNNPASVDAPWATVEIVAWDNSSDLYPTWTEASVAWMHGPIVGGHSAPFNVANIGGTQNTIPFLTSARGANQWL
jgi:hypothetical protein